MTVLLLIWMLLIICCVHLTWTIPGEKSKAKCEEYAKEVYQEEASPVLLPNADINLVSVCGSAEVPLIVGGTKAKPKEFPHMARVGFGNEANISWSCGGSLVSELYILTAAHCVNTKDKGPARWVRLEEEGEDSSHQTLSVAERVVHPDYKQPSRYNDIALLKLDREVTFSGFVRPACLHTKAALPGVKGIATGYGRMEYGKAIQSNIDRFCWPSSPGDPCLLLLCNLLIEPHQPLSIMWFTHSMYFNVKFNTLTWHGEVAKDFPSRQTDIFLAKKIEGCMMEKAV